MWISKRLYLRPAPFGWSYRDKQKYILQVLLIVSGRNKNINIPVDVDNYNKNKQIWGLLPEIDWSALGCAQI